MLNEAIFQQLNPQQAAAVQATEGPMLIIAGAGSGKTKVLTCRIAHLLTQGVEPWRILAITFTNKAAKEMRERVDKLAGFAAKDVELRTFHSFCARLLRREAEHLPGYNKNFAIYDTDDQKKIIKQILKDMGRDEKKYPINGILSRISDAKNCLLSPDEFATTIHLNYDFYSEEVAKIYPEYQKRLKQNNAVDFDDLLFLSVKLLTENEDIRKHYQEQFLYIMVDEYQDTNRVQYILTKLLTGPQQNLCVVGDADQSIYGWRGADIHNILDFEKDYPNAQIVKLEQNYRSTKNILDAANAVIANNIERKPKNLWTEKVGGTPIYFYHADTDIDEAYFISDQIRKLNEQGFASGDMAVLYRTNAQSRVLEETLIKQGLPYVIVGGTRFYERKEIKDALAYLHVIANPYDSLNLLRIINVPKRGIGDTTINKLAKYAKEQNAHLFDVLSNPEAVPELNAGTVRKLDTFAQLIFELVSNANSISTRDLLDQVLNRTGMLAELENSMNPQEQARGENLKEFLSVAEDFAHSGEEDTLPNFLEHVALVSDIDTAQMQSDAVTLMTLHSAKGLEFRVVFMVGMEQGIFPVIRSDEVTKIEEERRLCYVGMTRAQEILYLCNTQNRLLYGTTKSYPESQFLSEVPEKLLQPLRKKKTEELNPRAPKQNFFREKPKPISNVPEWAKKALGGYTPLGGNATKDNFSVGDKVRHNKFGDGVITDINEQPDCQELIIDFNGTEKTLLTKYAKITKI